MTKKNQKKNKVKESSEKKSSGFTLIEVMVSMGIGSLVLFGLAAVMAVFAKQMRGLETSKTRSDITREIRAAGQDILAYEASRIFTSGLEPCIRYEEGGSLCMSRSGGELIQHPLQLVSSFRPDFFIAGPETPVGSLVPVYYDLDGRRCDAGDPPERCLLQAIVSFSAYCPNQALSCTGAAALQLNYEVRLRGDVDTSSMSLAPFRPDRGRVVLSLSENSSLRLYDAVSTAGGYITEIQMGEGRPLVAASGDTVRVRVMVDEDVVPDAVQLRGYRLPSGCDFGQLGTGSCPRPSYADYPLLAEVDTSTSGQKSEQVLSFLVTSQDFYEVIAVSVVGGAPYRRSNTVLRLTRPSVPIVEVTGPLSIGGSCIDDSPFQFNFTATDPLAEVERVRAWVTPLLKNGDNSLPGFTFDVTNPNPQPYFISYDAFNPGTNYTFHFEAENNIGRIRTASHEFAVRTPSELSMEIRSPRSGDFIRAVDDLTVQANINLECGDSITDFTFEVLKLPQEPEDEITVMMPPVSVSCEPIPDQSEDRNGFICRQTFSCNEWLGVPDCEEYYPVGEESFQVVARATSPGIPEPPLVRTQDFSVGGKIGVEVDEGVYQPQSSARFVMLKDHYQGALTKQVRLLFRGPLPEDTTLQYQWSTGGAPVQFVVPQGATEFEVPIDLPPSDVTYSFVTFSPTDQSESYIGFVGRDQTEFYWYDIFSDCSTQVQPPSCSAGQVLTQEVHQSTSHNNNYSQTSAGIDLTYRSEGNLDVVIFHKRENPNWHVVRFFFEIRHDAATTTTPFQQMGLMPLPQIFYISDEYWEAHRNQAYMEGLSISGRAYSGARYDTLFIRQCYCADP